MTKIITAWENNEWSIELHSHGYKEYPKIFKNKRQVSPLTEDIPKVVAVRFWEYILACDSEPPEECQECPTYA